MRSHNGSWAGKIHYFVALVLRPSPGEDPLQLRITGISSCLKFEVGDLLHPDSVVPLS